ncbi:PRC-barrel domain-containing protein, partial [Microvirga roseola]|uniref:PRC-barrel domain-containing protein n=1 Tax=Microvirga roseola TaxID=2883126 RepID=UPI001E510217
RVVINQAEGQPNVRFEQQGEPNVRIQQQQARQIQQGQRQAAISEQQMEATGALPGAGAIAVSEINDMDLYNARGNELGDVERVVLGQDGRQYLVIGAGGFLGIGERNVLIPMDQVAMRGDRLVIQGITEDQIRAMPAYDNSNRNTFRELENEQQVQINAMR